MSAELVPVMMWLWCNAFPVAFTRLQGIKMNGIASWLILVTLSKTMRPIICSVLCSFLASWPVLGTFWQRCRCLGYDCFYKFLQYLVLAKYGEFCTLWSTVKERTQSKLSVPCPFWMLHSCSVGHFFCSPLVYEPWDYCTGEGCRGQMQWICKETCFDWFGANYSVRKSQLRNRTA